MTTETLLAIHAQAQAEIVELDITEAIRRDRIAIEQALCEMRLAEVDWSFLSHCHRCQGQCRCGMIGGEPTVLKPGEHDKYPSGRARALEG